MSANSQIIEIGIVMYPDAHLTTLHGLTDLLIIAGELASDGSKGQRSLRVSHWRTRDGQEPLRVFDTHPSMKGEPAVLVVPPRLGEPVGPAMASAYSGWLKDRHGDGTVLCSVCAGAFLLAETGLLEGRRVTTHWMYAEALAARFPGLILETEKLIIDDGDVMTAGGLMAWIDLGLRLVDRFLGPSVMLETARFLLVDPPGREQRYYSHFSPKLQHGDAQVLKVQHWLQATGAKDATLHGMAAKAGLEERTFLRRFRKATGLKPTEYCQHLRVGKAREMLEFTRKSQEQIAWSVGYEDPGAFRKVFQKVMGLTPAEYRLRFGVAGQDTQKRA